jgi:hypothetical protein
MDRDRRSLRPEGLVRDRAAGSGHTVLAETDGGTYQSLRQRPAARLVRPLVDGEPLTPFTRAAMAADVTASLVNWGSEGLKFINADYTLTLSRLPEGSIIGLASQSHSTHDGVATGSATLFDQQGQIGTSVAVSLAQSGFRPPSAEKN